ncbi:TetR family transcriptional regulator [Paraburkholderia sp. CNPSo 3076]|uniref:TetR/AcrR family transcriptional regulator n=1 Tax=Paraburkholderia sp. CNPSo 3076 TaxID=2940936 RepID=UPI00224CFB5E|nr:TetR family transcriptional regulator [Paraburkholderia sp. CNPSo 3076]MCX5540080.1 TetR family transcriptional regulator [Paraburkholderia sp. CNPSo 3076]
MKVTKAQAQANRAHVVETASTLFRERGYDGVGVADLMGAAGFTHGGFYKHFRSKTDLMAESAACGIAQTAALSAGMNESEFVRLYLAREHRDSRATGCTMAALGGDAARQPEAVRATFADGIERLLEALRHERCSSDGADSAQARANCLDILAHAVGAIVMSRACPDDSPLADEILTVCRDKILASLGPSATGREPAPNHGSDKSAKPK